MLGREVHMADLGFWMAMFTLGALAYYGTPLGRIIRAGARLLWASVQPLLTQPETAQPRDPLGRWQSPGEPVTTAGNDPERTLPAVTSQVTALESGVTIGNDVTEVVTTREAIYITAELVQGTAPSVVAKQLPGFSPRNYQQFKAKVDHVKEILTEYDQAELASPR
jgi:hypothetical protein